MKCLFYKLCWFFELPSIAFFQYLFVERYFDRINPQAIIPVVMFLSSEICDRSLQICLDMNGFDKYH